MDLAQLNSFLNQHICTLLYFSTPDCNVCSVLRPQVETLIEEYPRWSFQYIDISKSPEISGQFLVFAVPTLIMMVDGKEATRFSRHISMGDLKEKIQLNSGPG